MKTNRKLFKKVLIANRGECAVRISRACRELDIRSIAVYSEQDRRSMHVLMADDAYLIGPAPLQLSYLNISKIIEAAKATGAEAIHPGWGLLAENASFARAVTEAGMEFIGPSADIIEKMTDKLATRHIMAEIGVPLLPASEKPIENVQEAKEIAEKIGFPIIIKSMCGGGGRGLRVVHNVKTLPRALQLAQGEGKNYFGDSRVYIEKYLNNAKNIEVQVFGDKLGNIVHVFDRECTLQRRHQQILEGCPSIAITNEMREELTSLAVKAAKYIGFVGAGTFEFLVDCTTKEFFFIEMTPRLQAEHTITEMVTGIDLVEEQLSVAAGNPLGMTQEDVSLRGYAIEARIYAEDPVNHLPSPGQIHICWPPQGPFVRIDSAAYSDYRISAYYDPLIAKVIAWGHNREESIERLQRALTEFILTGVKSNIVLHKAILDHPVFLDGGYTTEFVEKHIKISESDLFTYIDDEVFLIASAISSYNDRRQRDMRNFQVSSRWKTKGRKSGLRV